MTTPSYQEASISFIKSLAVSDEDVRRISKLPQRTDEWMKARENRITGSRIGAMIGMNPYQDADSALKDFLWGSNFKGNAATRRGTRLEPYAAKSLVRKLRAIHGLGVELAIPGLVVCKKEPVFAYSPDGVLLFPGGRKALVEIKAPFNRKCYEVTPRQYYCQVQLGMWVMDLEECFFVEYCGEGRGVLDDENTFIKIIKRNDHFIDQTMLPSARKFYLDRYVPLKLAQKEDDGSGTKIRKHQLFSRASLEVRKNSP